METLGFLNIGPLELIVAAVIGLLLFGRRLPEVGRSLGRGIVEFKKGLKDVKEDLDSDVNDKGQSQGT
ncbi:MAG: twin-arginine translocase TatA/TatE family subunit [Planctomycetes bacterium]|nr:twin-arginine translocase TatA/TatE family subunit [Planctomycetota bacterium]